MRNDVRQNTLLDSLPRWCVIVILLTYICIYTGRSEFHNSYYKHNGDTKRM